MWSLAVVPRTIIYREVYHCHVPVYQHKRKIEKISIFLKSYGLFKRIDNTSSSSSKHGKREHDSDSLLGKLSYEEQRLDSTPVPYLDFIFDKSLELLSIGSKPMFNNML